MKSCVPQLVLLIAVCVVTFGCGDPTIRGPVSGDPVVNVDDSNVEMNQAIDTARETFPQFVDNWKSMPADGVSVKFGMATRDGGVEHIWFEPIKITETEITGTCGNDPVNIAGLKLGDVRTFDRSELTDWMILVGAECYGGYTVRVLVKMEPENAPPLKFVDF